MEIRVDDKFVNMYKEHYGIDVVGVNITKDSIVEISYRDKDTKEIKKNYRDLEDIVNELLSI